MIQCEYLFLPEVQYLYFKREFLNGQFLTHSALLIRVGNYTSKPLYLMSCATEVGGHFPFPSSLCPTLIKINSFVFPAEKPFHVVWLKTKSTIPPHYQTWPHVTQSSQSEYIYIVLLGTEIRSLKVLPRTYPPPKPVVVGRIIALQIYQYSSLQNLWLFYMAKGILQMELSWKSWDKIMGDYMGGSNAITSILISERGRPKSLRCDKNSTEW